ncbi:MAG: hypothetical protein IPH32_10745 [Bacteroidetes bacterium]|jgi:hypothetical protein|nr:hypothetical protein [Bacteroidota bacterium]
MYSDNWSTKFITDKLTEGNYISNITNIENNFSEIIRKKGLTFKVFTISLEDVEISTVKEIVNKYTDINIIANIKKVYKISGETINFLHSKNISFGGMGDLMRFSSQEDNEITIDKEFDYISRGLRQHLQVKSFERLDNRRVKIKRHDLKDVIAIMLNDYEISVESVRSSKDLYKDFQIIVKTNPNGGITSEAKVIAGTLNIEICTWGDFLGKLNTFWN